MKKFFAAVAVALACFMAPAIASTSAENIQALDVSKLTNEQKAELMSKAVSMQQEVRKAPVNISQTVRTEASAWADLGTNMGRAAVATARELGMAANEFVNTPLGKLTMGIVIFKVMGMELAGLVIGASILIFMLSLALYFVLRKDYKGEVQYENIPVFFGLYTRRVVASGHIDVDMIGWNRFCAAIIMVIGLTVGLTTMF